VRAAEKPLGSERLTQAVARYFAKLLAIKDEYEVARLYTDGGFEAALKSQFESWDGLRFHLAPPLLAKPGPGGRPQKIVFGGWMWKGFQLLARFKGLRGTPFDVFGYTHERRMERQLVVDYEALIERLLQDLDADKLDLAVQLARLPERIRGYGPVKEANVKAVKQQWGEMLARYGQREAVAA
jgi:indolepyruvate ferredoxin oxidoreductase